jgi:hypothetical protein
VDERREPTTILSSEIDDGGVSVGGGADTRQNGLVAPEIPLLLGAGTLEHAVFRLSGHVQILITG